jgi:16S rRNA (cytidine1402-2'-O)-methyltransferase
LRVIPIPGPCAAAAALSVSGFTDDAFHFAGFLPAKAGQRDTALRALVALRATLVFYEAPHRIAETVDALRENFGPERRIVFAREVSKLFEEIHRCPLSDAAAWLLADVNRGKGEFVLLVEGAPERDEEDWTEADRILGILLAQCSVKQAAGLAAEITGLKKNALYERALRLKEDQGT